MKVKDFYVLVSLVHVAPKSINYFAIIFLFSHLICNKHAWKVKFIITKSDNNKFIMCRLV
jgi:hypothetical protein